MNRLRRHLTDQQRADCCGIFQPVTARSQDGLTANWREVAQGQIQAGSRK